MNDAQVVMNAAAELAPATAVRLTVPGERAPVPLTGLFQDERGWPPAILPAPAAGPAPRPAVRLP